MKRLYLALFALLVTSFAFGQVASVQDGDWDDPNTWDCACTPSSSDPAISIFHNVLVPSALSVTIDESIINAFGSLTVAGTLTLANGSGTDLDVFNDGFDYGFLTVDGTLINNDGATIVGTDGTNANFNSGSIYRHLYTTTEGSIPNATWDVNSTVQIQGYTGAITATGAGNWGQSFGNFTFNCSGLGTNSVQLSGLLTDVQNDLTISATGTTGSLRFSNTENPTIAIGRDLIVSGTSRGLFGAGTNTTVNITRDLIFTSINSTGTNFATTGTTTVNVNRDFSMSASGGRLNFASSALGSGVLNVTGNFTLTAGTVFFGSASTATGTLNISGNLSNSGTLTEGSSSTSAGNVNFVGSAIHTFTNSGTISLTINFSVAILSTLDLGTSSITGSGTFTLNGTMRLGSTDAAGALQAGTSGGNIRVSGTRTYASNSTIVYNGAAAQFIGDGFPPSGAVNLTINNSNNVTLSTSLDILAVSLLTLTSGNIVIGAQTLTINGTVTGSGGLVGGASSNLVIGGTGNFGTLTFSGTNQLNNFTLNRTSSGLVTLGGNLTILGTLTHTAGTLAIASNTLTISGAYGPANPDDLSVTSSSTIVIDGSGSLPSDVGFAGTAINTLTLNRASTTLTTTSSITITNLNLTSGTFSNGSGITIATGGTINRVGGSMSTNPTNTTNSYNVVYTSGTITTGPELPSNTTALANLSKTGSGTLTLGSNITINGILTLSSGSFSAGTNTIDLKGNFVSSAGSTLTSSAITFSGTTTISGISAPVFGGITITGTLTPTSSFQIDGNLANNGVLDAGSATTTFGGTTTISGSSTSSFNNVTISGTLTAPAGNFNVAGTWTNNGTFTSGTSTVVFNGTTSIAGSSTTNFRNITISGTLTSPSTLNVAGNFTNNGTFTSGTGTLLLNGSDTQSISGTTLTAFNNITVTNIAGPPSVQVQSNQTLQGTLTLLANSIFDADGSSGTAIFTLLSTGDSPTVDASIATIPSGASVTGSVTVQRFMAIEGGSGGNGRIYRYIASPVQVAPVSQIQIEIPVTGSFTGTSSCSGCGTTQSMFLYNETIAGGLDTGYEDFPASTNAETLTTGRGYTLFVRGDVAPVSTAGNARWDVRGTINSGDVVFNSFVTRSGAASDDGWNLVGNPYPSTIDWDAAGWTKTGINNAIYMRNNGLASPVFATYIAGVGLNGGSRFIPLGQAFWIKSDAGSIDFRATESVKSGGTQTTFFRVGSISDLLRIALNDGTISDESAIRFSADATAEFDPNLDAYKLKNPAVNLSSVTDQGTKLAINSLPALDCTSSISLDVSDVAAGSYSFDFSGFDSFDDSVQFMLTDTFLGYSVDVKSNTHYDFQVTSDSASFGSERFKIIISEEGINNSLAVNGDQKCDTQNLEITIDASQNDVFYQPYYNGVTVGDSVQGNGGTILINLNGDPFTVGLFEVSVKAFSTCSELFLDQRATIEIFEFDEAVIENEGNTLISNYASGNQWFLDGVEIPGATGQHFDASESGLYTLLVTTGECTTSTDLQFVVTDAETPLIKIVQIYPNPFKEKFQVEVESSGPVHTKIFDVLGAMVSEQSLNGSGIVKTGEFDLSGTPNGMYILHIHKGNTVYQVKIIKSTE